MLEINLLPVREAKRKADVRQQLMQLLLAVIVTCGGIAVLHSRLMDDRSSAEVRVSQMRQDLEQFEPQRLQVEAFKKKKAELEKKLDIIHGLEEARTGPVMLLAELASRAPANFTLTSVKTKGNRIEMKGRSLDNEIVATFLSDLGASKYFDQVDLDSTEIGQNKEGGLKVVNFEITARLVSSRDQGDDTKDKKKKNKKRRETA